MKPRLIKTTPEEDADINAGIVLDPDTIETNVEDFARLRPAGDVHPGIMDAYRRSRGERGQQKAPVKSRINIRLSADVLASFKATGPGWQTRIDTALKEWIAMNSRM